MTSPTPSLRAALLVGALALCPSAFAQDDAADGAEEATADAVALADGAVAPVATQARGNTYDAVFATDLYRPEPLTLGGIMATQTVPFRFPETWRATGDAEVHLMLSHSSTLLPRRSSLTLLVNNKAVHSTFLDETNVKDGEIIATVPAEYLKPYNELSLMVTQHYTTDCEDPFDPNLWTRVSNESFIRFNYERRPVTGDLSVLPAPFFEESGVGDVELALVGNEPMSSAAISALGEIGFSFGRMADYRALDVSQTVSSVRQADRHALLVGLYDEHPEIASLLGSQRPEAGEGLVAVVPNPADPTLGVLIVTGRSKADLMEAATAVSAAERQEALSGTFAKIETAIGEPPPSHRSPQIAPPSRSFTLSDLSVEDRTVRGFFSEPVRFDIMLEGDAKVSARDAEMELHFGYGAQLDNRLSTVEVRLEGVTLANQPLNRPEGDQDATLSVVLPHELMRPTSAVEVVFHLFPKQFNACERVSDRMIWGTVFDTTRFTVARNHVADMPDLGRLQYNMWPYTLQGAEGATTIIAPDAPSRADGAAVFTLAGALGRYRPVPNPTLEATTGADVGGYPAGHAILLAGGKNTVYTALAESGSLAQQGREDRVQQRAVGEEVMRVNSADNRPWIEQLQHPGSGLRDKSLLVLRSPTRDGVLDLAQQLADGAFLSTLSGNVATLTTDVNPRAETSMRGDTVRVGAQSSSESFRIWAETYAWLILLVLGGFALLFSLTVTLWARRSGGHT